MLEPMLERGRKPGDLILFQTVLLPGLGVARMANPGTILFLAKDVKPRQGRQESTHVREKPSGFELGLG
jgi:hypothetical protein